MTREEGKFETVDPARWARIEDLFDRALEVPEGERAAFLAAECGGDEGLRSEVESLLGRGEEAASLHQIIAAEIGRVANAGTSAPGAGDRVAGRFTIRRQLGAGAMGVVFEALDEERREVVALKMLERMTPRSMAEERVRRFEREAEVLALLEHEAIVRYISHGVAETGEPYLVMEWLDGEDLSARLRRGPLSVDETVTIARRIADGLAQAHARGIVHRDLKPSNIFLPNKDLRRCTLIDFGVARHLQREAMTGTGQIVGTPAYMSPEQACGQPGVDARTDIFALGAVLFECIVGKPLFQGESAIAVLSKLLLEDAPRLGDCAPDVPVWLALLVDRMLVRDLGSRPVDGACVVAMLDARAEKGTPRASMSGRGLSRLFVVMAQIADDPADEAAAASGGVASSARTASSESWWSASFQGSILANGTRVLVVSGDGEAGDIASEAARRALQLQKSIACTRIALATGLGSLGQGAPVGEVIDVASRLLGNKLFADGAIIVDDTSADLLRSRFVLRDREHGTELIEEAPFGGPERLVLGRGTPCVGRDRELGFLEGLFAECVDEAVARAILVTAPAGYGKSRLCQEFLRSVTAGEPGLRIFTAQGDPMRAGSPLGIVGSLVRSGLGLGHEPEPGVALRALADRLAHTIPAEEAKRTARFLGELVGISTETDAELVAARADLRLLRDHLLRAFEIWLRFEARTDPVLLVLDDLHWGDAASLQYIDWILERLAQRPVFVLGFARAEVRELFPELWRRAGVQELSLPPLGRRACERLVRHVMSDEVSDATLDRICSLSAGNAFFVEELIRVVAKGHGELPQSLLASAQVRLERLPIAEQQILRAASLFGGVFWDEGVDRILATSGEAVSVIERLVAAELVEAQLDSRFVGKQEYKFSHVLLRDAAYSLLREDDCAKGHVLAAEWLIEAGEPDALTIATHLDRGGDASRAAMMYLAAAEQELRGGSFEAALARTRRARELGLSPEGLLAALGVELEACKWLARAQLLGETAREIIRTAPASSALRFQAIAELAMVAPGFDELADYARLVSEAEPLPGGDNVGTWLVAACRVSLIGVMSGFDTRVDALVQQAERIAAEAGALDPRVEGWMWELRAVLAGGRKPDDYLAALRRARACFERADDYRNACAEALYECGGLVLAGSLGEGERAARALLERVDEYGLVRLRAKVEVYLAASLLWQGHADQARELLLAAIPKVTPPVAEYYIIVGQTLLADAELALGNLDAAERAARVAHERGSAWPFFEGAGVLAWVLLARGRVAEAFEVVRAEPRLATGVVWWDRIRHFGARAKALEALGRADDARAVISDVVRFIDEVAASFPDLPSRERFLADNVDAARVLQLARELGLELG